MTFIDILEQYYLLFYNLLHACGIYTQMLFVWYSRYSLVATQATNLEHFRVTIVE